MSARQQELVFPCHGFDINQSFYCDFAPQGCQQKVNGVNWYGMNHCAANAGQELMAVFPALDG
jgi:hypothetical protein